MDYKIKKNQLQIKVNFYMNETKSRITIQLHLIFFKIIIEMLVIIVNKNEKKKNICYDTIKKKTIVL